MLNLLRGTCLPRINPNSLTKSLDLNRVLQNEINVVQKSLRNVKLRIAVCFPNKYRIGMSNLAIKILYSWWNKFEQVFAERAFLPEGSDTEPPRTLESQTYLKSFDVLAFTLQFELDYINILRMLKNSGIPLYRKDRTWNQHPIIIVGGPAVTANPLVMSPFVDAIFQGEFEAVANELTEALFYRDSNLLEKVTGIYLPESLPLSSCYARILDLNTVFYPTAQVRNLSDNNWQEIQTLGGYMLQASRGCNRGCKFCLIGKLTRGGANYAMRERSPTRLIELAEKGTKETQVDKVSLIGSGVGDYSNLPGLLRGLNDRKIKFSIPSIRADTDLAVVNEVVRAGQRTMTIAPEVGSDELRFQMAKRISNQQFCDFAKYSYDCGIKHLKLYYILGLPDQSLDEVQHMIDFVKGMNPWFKGHDLNVTVAFFIPKRQTPYDRVYIGQEQVDLMEKQAKLLGESLRDYASLHPASTKWSIIQTILSIGDERLAPYLEQLAQTPASQSDWVRVLNGNPIKFLEHMQDDGLHIPLEIK